MRVNLPAAVIVGLALDVIDCADCGTVFGVPSSFNAQRRRHGDRFYCPAGHGNVYDPGELDRATARAAAAERDRDAARAEARAARDQAAAAERERRRTARELGATLQRVHNGVCPHCGRTFKQLAAHMTRQHAELRAASERLRLDAAAG